MFTRRRFVKSAVYAGAGVFIVEPLLQPLTALAHYVQPKGSDAGMERLLNHIYTMIQQNPDKYGMALNMVELAGLNIRHGNKQNGLVLLSEAIETAREEKPHQYASLLNSVAEIHCNCGEEAKAIETASESFKILSGETGNEYADISIVDNARMLDRMGNREKALWLLDERYKKGFLTPSLACAYADIGLCGKGMEVANQMPYPILKIKVMANLAERCANNDKGLAHEIHKFLSEIIVSRKADKEGRAAAYISSAYAKLGDWDSAFAIASHAWNSEECYYRIATHAVNAGRMDIARRAAYPALADIKAEDKRYTFALPFPEIAELFLALGDTSQAVVLLRRSIEYLEKNEKIPAWVHIDEFSDSAAVFIKMMDKKTALNLLHKAFDKVIAEGNIAWKIEELIKITGVYVDNRLSVGKRELAYAEDILASCGRACTTTPKISQLNVQPS